MYLGIRIYSRTAKNGSYLSHQYLLQSKNYISPCGCQRADCFVSKESNRVHVKMVGLIGLEPMTPALSRRCSNQLSYRPRGVPIARNFKFEISNLKLRREALGGG